MAAPSSHMWYVRAAGEVWGPYPEARLKAFIDEGRVAAHSELSPWRDGPFAPAADSPEFADLLSMSRLAAQAQDPAPAPTPAPVYSAGSETQDGAAAAGPARAVLVWARLDQASTGGFYDELRRLGTGVTLQPGLWLVQAREGAAALRNRLSRGLGPSDALLVVEAPLEHAAWFNLDPVRDREARRIWALSGLG